jgi:opacity protein-like surface antigen
MYKKFTRILKISLLFLFMIAEVFASGGKRNGTAGAQELLIPVGARGLAFSGSYVSGISGVDAIYYNPAGLSATTNSTEALFTYMNYIADIGISYAAIGVNFEGFGALGFSIKSLDFGDIPVTTTENPYGTGATFSPTFVTLGLTYSNTLTDRIRVGVNVNLVSEKIVRTSASGVSLDVGVQYSGIAEIEGLNLGVVLKNFGPQMSFDGPDLLRNAVDNSSNRGTEKYQIQAASFELPSQLELGLSYERHFSDDYKALIITSFQNNNFANDEYRAAAEFSFKNMFAVRGGYAYQPDAAGDPEESLFGPTFGAGINIQSSVSITVDYAYRWARYFDANHMFSIKLGF